jgi:hypothetical protein
LDFVDLGFWVSGFGLIITDLQALWAGSERIETGFRVSDFVNFGFLVSDFGFRAFGFLVSGF